VALGVELEGKIALARYGGPFRGLKVKNAQEHGMVGCLIYTDVKDDGNITTANGYAPYPEGWARNPTAVQRGSVQFLSIYPGDPTTPGYPSKEGSPRTGITKTTPQIPSIPISWQDALPLLEALDGYGPSGAEINRTNWIGAADAGYNSGPAPGATISMSNKMNNTITWIWNSIGIINGTHPNEVLLIGNHRDAWMIGGAADPNSGSAVMIELSKAFGALLKTGWQPRRTIVLASWDAEEYGLVGSTEWFEEYVPWITNTNVAYINLDIAVSGSVPSISATPDFHHIAIETMKKVVFPYKGLTNVTMYDVWNELNEGEVGVLGSGSDYTAWLHHKGISSIDMGSDAGPTDPVYHYHTNYDTYHWMSTFADPGFLYHKAMGQYITLLTYHMATEPILPLQFANYGVEMTSYITTLEETIATANAASSSLVALDLSELVSAIETFNASASALSSYIATADLSSDIIVSAINAKIRDYQRGFTSQGGLPTREFYRNVVFAPGLDTGYAPVTWPGVTEAITEYRNWTMAEEWVGRSARGVLRAAEVLMP
jgi:N-acetylated-alpha-linked acidic dipeptidase